MNCCICGGPAHSATGAQYTKNSIACGPCVRDLWYWHIKRQNSVGRRKGILFYDHVNNVRGKDE